MVSQLAEKMVRLALELLKIIRIVPSQKVLIGLVCNVEYKAISAESGTAHGLSPRLAILDQVGQVRGPHDAFIEAQAMENFAQRKLLASRGKEKKDWICAILGLSAWQELLATEADIRKQK